MLVTAWEAHSIFGELFLQKATGYEKSINIAIIIHVWKTIQWMIYVNFAIPLFIHLKNCS